MSGMIDIVDFSACRAGTACENSARNKNAARAAPAVLQPPMRRANRMA
jgi:hypothetical protein